MKKYIVCLLAVVLTVSSFADFRVWKDKKGNSIEAELVHVTAVQVVLKDRKGKLYKFNPTKLSAADQNYLATAFPPEMNIEFKKRTSNTKDGYWDEKTTSMSGDVKISKKDKRKYTKTMKVVLMMIAESETARDYIMVDRVESDFDFKTKTEYELKGNFFKMFVDRDLDYGVEYKAYLVVILDDQGKMLQAKSSSKEFREKCMLILKLKKNDRFAKDCRKTGTSNASVHRR